ncbi:MAG: DUF2877 domain-containing protein [Caldisericum sp.]|nr:DUF2877 domain-containing protein [Caldisericum sp.]
MKVISVGDKIDLKLKVLGIHSHFNHAINIYTDKGLVFIVSKDVGSGPNSIVLDENNLNKFTLDDISRFDYSFYSIYNSSFELFHKDLEVLVNNLKTLKDYLFNYAHPLSAVFLLDSSRKSNFVSLFSLNLANQLEESFNRLLNFDLNAIDSLKGLGYGLTPQGDDLIEGFLAAIYVYEKLLDLNLSSLRKTIYDKALTKNKVANTFLYFTSLGLFYERFKDVLKALFTGFNLEESILKMLSFGETSGADILTGFIKGFEKLLEGGNELWQ